LFEAHSYVPDITLFAVFSVTLVVLLAALFLLHLYERKTLELRAAVDGGLLDAAPRSPSLPPILERARISDGRETHVDLGSIASKPN
jgi:hypothetical protein